MINVSVILDLQTRNTREWHHQLVLTKKDEPWNFIEENHMWNFLLWHEEDIARVDNNLLRIVQAKRNIDKYNQERNNSIEKIDEWILKFLASKKVAAIDDIHSETPGMMIDRLSIMALKRYHMLEETYRQDITEEHKEHCDKKVVILDEQITDLANCLKKVLVLLECSKLKFKVYRQLKMYNDPNLNPELYRRAQFKVDNFIAT
jgi:hypothetical protein